jgi:hypothetical protein
MPKINKSFHLEVTVEQFLNACSAVELQEINMRLDSYLRKAMFAEKRKHALETLDLILKEHSTDQETHIIDESLLKSDSAINHLAMAGIASKDIIVDFTLKAGRP